MLFTRVFLILLVSCFFPFSVLGNSACDCEKIIKEKKCDNPDCIQICNLQSVFDSTGQLLQKKCMKKIKTKNNKKEKFKEKELFSAKTVKGTKVPGLLNRKKRVIQTIEQKNTYIVKKNCPGCYLHSKVTAKIIPQTEKEKCDKHIKTEKYKLWKKHTMDDSAFCNSSEDGQTKEQEKLCELNHEYEYCCDHLKPYEPHYVYIQNPSHQLVDYFESQKSWMGNYPKDMTLKKQSSSCEKNHISLINAYLNDYEKALRERKGDILRQSSVDFLKKIWTDCPTGCSFAVSYAKNINSNQCYGDLEMKVICTHRKKTKWTGNPLYDISIDYKGDVKCQ